MQAPANAVAPDVPHFKPMIEESETPDLGASADVLAARRARRAEAGDPAVMRRAEAAEAAIRNLETHLAALEQRLEEVGQERERIAQQLAEREHEVRGSKQREYAEQQLRVETEERGERTQREMRAQIHELNRRLDETERHARELGGELEEVRRELSEAHQAMALGERVRERGEELRERLLVLEERFAGMQREIAVEREAREQAEGELAVLRERDARLTPIVYELMEVASELRAGFERELGELRDELQRQVIWERETYVRELTAMGARMEDLRFELAQTAVDLRAQLSAEPAAETLLQHTTQPESEREAIHRQEMADALVAAVERLRARVADVQEAEQAESMAADEPALMSTPPTVPEQPPVPAPAVQTEPVEQADIEPEVVWTAPVRSESVVEPPPAPEPPVVFEPLVDAVPVETPAVVEPTADVVPVEPSVEVQPVEPPIAFEPLADSLPAESPVDGTSVEPPVEFQPLADSLPVEPVVEVTPVEPPVAFEPLADSLPVEPPVAFESPVGVKPVESPIVFEPPAEEEIVAAEEAAAVEAPESFDVQVVVAQPEMVESSIAQPPVEDALAYEPPVEQSVAYEPPVEQPPVLAPTAVESSVRGPVSLQPRPLSVPEERISWLAPAIRRLAEQRDAKLAAELVIELLPAQRQVVDGSVKYEIKIDELGSFHVTLDPERGIVSREGSSASTDFSVEGSAAALSELAGGGVSRRMGGLRIRKGRRRARRLLKARKQPVALADLAAAGIDMWPGLLLLAMAEAIDPSWTTGRRFELAFEIVNTTGIVIYVRICDGEPILVSRTASGKPVATVSLTEHALMCLLAGTTAEPEHTALVSGDATSVEMFLQWTARAQGLSTASA